MSAGPRRLTPQQEAALEARGASVALSAGAGCGKTFVLTRRFLGLLDGDSPLAVDEIVALTFTEKAARELRDRVRRGCRERAEAVDGPEAFRWRDVLRDLEAARIGTFHNFCATILRRFPIEAGIDPAFEVLDPALAPILREEALNLCLRRWLSSEDSDLIGLAIDGGLDTVRGALAAALANPPDLDLAAWSRRTPEEVVASWEDFRRRVAVPEALASLRAEQREFASFLASRICSHVTGEERRRCVVAALESLPEVCDPGTFLEGLRENAKIQGGGNQKNWDSQEVYDRVLKGYSRLRDQIDKLKDVVAPDNGRSLPAARLGLAFARLTLEALEQYADAKRARGVLDFHDLQAKVLGLLRDGPESVRDELRRSLGALLVDEFQDTDPTQAAILDALAGPDAEAGRLFLVGDVKQSIYGFRGAEPALFEAYRDRFPEAGRLGLTENFRSVPGVLAFVNAVFAGPFPGPEHALSPGGDWTGFAEPDQPAVEFLWTEGADDAKTGRKTEAAALARLLARRLEEGWPIRDPASGGIRPATPGDVALLFRTGTDFPVYEQALADAGLDYHLVGGSTYFAQQEVIDLINLLTTLEDPLDAIALAGTLRGPIFGLSDEGLFWLATAAPGELPASLARWRKVAESLDANDLRAVERAEELLARWRGWKDRMPVASLLDRCLEESGFEAALLGEFLGDRKRANVRKLVRLARTFDEGGGFGLADFVARLRANLDDPPKEEQAATTDEHGRAVRLMTIHQAKGLEFPIVVLPDLERQGQNETSYVVHHRDLGVLVRPASDAGEDEDAEEEDARSLGRELFKVARRRVEEAESQRIFYVATTRARDSLLLSATYDVEKPPKQMAMRLLDAAFDLATGLPRGPIPPGGLAPRVGRIDAPPVPATRSRRGSGHRPKLLIAARRIADAGRIDAPAIPETTPRPAYVDLDPRRDDRLTRLLRAVVAAPPWPRRSVSDLIDEVSRSLGEWTTPRDRERAVALLAEGRISEVWTRVARSEACRGRIEWTLAWPPSGPTATVYRGRIDRLFRGPSGAWEGVCVAIGEITPTDRLNAALANLAAERLGLGPVAMTWIVGMGPAMSPTERILAEDDDAFESAIREFDERRSVVSDEDPAPSIP